METITKPNVADLIAQSKQNTEMAKGRLLRTFEFIPDDKLTYSPAPTCKHALRIVAHCAVTNNIFATILRGEDLPVSENPDEARAKVAAMESSVTSREAAVKSLEDSTAAVMSALDKVTAESLETSPMSPFGPFPMSFWMALPAMHMGSHAGQIDYIQTIWDDQEFH